MGEGRRRWAKAGEGGRRPARRWVASGEAQVMAVGRAAVCMRRRCAGRRCEGRWGEGSAAGVGACASTRAHRPHPRRRGGTARARRRGEARRADGRAAGRACTRVARHRAERSSPASSIYARRSRLRQRGRGTRRAAVSRPLRMVAEERGSHVDHARTASSARTSSAECRARGGEGRAACGALLERNGTPAAASSLATLRVC